MIALGLGLLAWPGVAWSDQIAARPGVVWLGLGWAWAGVWAWAWASPTRENTYVKVSWGFLGPTWHVKTRSNRLHGFHRHAKTQVNQ